MATGATSKPDRSRLSSLDVLRFLAAASVMIYHFTYDPTTPNDRSTAGLQAVTMHGYLGVEVFFMISGFVILWSAQGRTATAFVRARILRLYPEFWIAVVLSALIFRLAPGDLGGAPSVVDVLANLTMVPQLAGLPYVDGVYWTLFVELKFYFLLWLLILFGQVPRIERWLIGCIAISAIGLFVELPGALRSLLILPYGPLFAAGGLFFLVFDSGWTAPRAVGLLLALPTASTFAVRGMSGFIDAAHIDTTASVATIGIIVGAFVFFATLGRNDLGARLGRITTVAGALTYPLYLLHNTGKALFLQGWVAAPEPVLVAGALLFSLALSYVVMRLGTGPVHAWLRRRLDATIALVPFLRPQPST
ncbi:MAG: acyltransferase [Gemmatimonadetes bacterium]|nr:acyltransferase [Gemmatimonadota bacterium]